MTVSWLAWFSIRILFNWYCDSTLGLAKWAADFRPAEHPECAQYAILCVDDDCVTKRVRTGVSVQDEEAAEETETP